jgi:hypothetical protein
MKTMFIVLKLSSLGMPRAAHGLFHTYEDAEQAANAYRARAAGWGVSFCVMEVGAEDTPLDELTDDQLADALIEKENDHD